MKVLFLHFHYKTPYQGGAIRSWYLCREFQKSGIQCEVITTYNGPNYLVQEIDGATIHFLPISYSNTFGFFKRVFSFWKYNRMAFHLARKLSRPDLMYAISTPLSIGSLAKRLKKALNVPYIFEIGDLWPEAPIQMGVLKNPWLIQHFRKRERQYYEAASGLVGMSPPISEHLQKISPQTPCITIPNFSDISFFQEIKAQRYFQFFEPETFVVVYTGAVGKANHVDFVLEAARMAEETGEKVGFVVMGEGSELERLEREGRSISTLRFLKQAPRKYVRQVLHSSDAVLISYKDIPVLETGSPNKYFDALACGKPVITNFRGWISDLNQEQNTGFSYSPEHTKELFQKISMWREEPDVLDQMGRNALDLARQFEVETQCRKLANWLASTTHVSLEVPVGGEDS